MALVYFAIVKLMLPIPVNRYELLRERALYKCTLLLLLQSTEGASALKRERTFGSAGFSAEPHRWESRKKVKDNEAE